MPWDVCRALLALICSGSLLLACVIPRSNNTVHYGSTAENGSNEIETRRAQARPVSSRVLRDSPALLLSHAHRGYCEPAFNGDCESDSKGAWTLAAREPFSACYARCMACANCNFVSFSAKERDCSWYSECDTDGLHTDGPVGSTFRTVRVKQAPLLLLFLRQLVVAAAVAAAAAAAAGYNDDKDDADDNNDY